MTPRIDKAILIIAVVVAIFIGVMDKARPHTAVSGFEYDAWCCNGNRTHGDCQEISSSTVQPIQGGFVVTLRPGDHRKVTKPHTFTIPQDKVRHSPDAQYHICLWPTENDARCFYAPPMGS